MHNMTRQTIPNCNNSICKTVLTNLYSGFDIIHVYYLARALLKSRATVVHAHHILYTRAAETGGTKGTKPPTFWDGGVKFLVKGMNLDTYLTFVLLILF